LRLELTRIETDHEKQLEDERAKAIQLLQSERDKNKKLILDIKWLFDELNHARDNAISSGRTFHFKSDQVQRASSYSLGVNIVDDRTPGEKRLSEIENTLKEQKKN